MSNRTKWLIVFGLLLLGGLVLAACAQPTPVVQKVVETVVVTEIIEKEGKEVVVTQVVEVTKEVIITPEPVAEGGECCDVYTIGIFEDPLTTNYWSYLGPDNSVWTAYIMGGQAASLYTYSDQRFDFVPSLAADLPPEPAQEGDFWVVTVPMVDNATWSDGEPITAHDVEFTVSTVLDLQLTGNWSAIFRADVLDHVEALDDYTVKFFFKDKPGLAQWQFAAAMGPILPEHVWGDIVAEARSFIEGLEEPTAPEGIDCEAEDLSEADQAACDEYQAASDAYAEAYANARKTLYEAEVEAQPAAGGYLLDTLEPGAFVQKTMNPNYYFKGATIKEYSDGTWILENPNGQSFMLYGNGEGDEVLNFVSGPYSPNIIFSIYGSQDAAFLALSNGEVDYVLNPLSLARGLREQAERGEGVVTYINPDNGVFYLAFNMRKMPYSLPEFREAVDILLDKEFVADKILQGTVIPAYSVVPNGNVFWWNPNIETPYVGMSRADRLNLAIQVLEDAGWTWETKPSWDEDDPDAQNVVPGTGLRMPNGELMPDTTILGPGPAYDPQRASFNQWISEWMRQIGMPAKSELTGFNTILTPVFISADFDMYILGWGLSIYPDYLCDFFYSTWGELEGGELVGYNTPGYNNPDFDAACDEFLAETDVKRAQEQVYALQELLAKDKPYIPLFYRQSIDLINKRVKLPYTETLGGIADANGFQTDAQVLK